jgi:hypothetical protein
MTVSLIKARTLWLDVHTVTYAPTDDGDRNVISSDHDRVACAPDRYDTDPYDEFSPMTPIQWAARYITRTLYISGPDCMSTYPASPTGWYAAPTYAHPYAAHYEDVTVHPRGFNADELLELMELVTRTR